MRDNEEEAPSRSDGYALNQVKFFKKMVIDRAASDKAGQTIYGEVECIHILPRHTKKVEIIRVVTDKDRAIYAPRYQAWLRAEEEGRSLDGTPLEVFPAVERHDIVVLTAHKPPIRTVEALAALAADKCPTPGIALLREKAIAFVENGNAAHMAEVVARLKATSAQQAARVDELSALLQDAQQELVQLREQAEAQQAAVKPGKPKAAARAAEEA